MTRREFARGAAAAATWLAGFRAAFAAGESDGAAGRPLAKWEPGHFQVHFIHTGVGESQFLVFPDSTTMMIDCGDLDSRRSGPTSLPQMPDGSRKGGEWIARYVLRANPRGKVVDYMLTSHYHSDHVGSMRDGWYPSGWGLAAKTLKFRRAIDRAYPTFDDPVPFVDTPDRVTELLRKLYVELAERDGLTVERFRLGATDQIVPLVRPEAAAGFSVRNICANGRVAYPDGTVRDLCRRDGKFARVPDTSWIENEMSCGSVFTYGKFRYFTAGDFSCKLEFDDGTDYYPEVEIGKAAGPVNVAKFNHHACYSMPPEAVRELRAQVYTGSVWNTVQLSNSSMATMCDRSLYPGERYVCPGIVAPRVRERIAGADPSMLRDVPEPVFEGAHVVVDVPPGGETYSLSFVTARDESMTVRSVMHFKS
jgi:hypothetical protein